MPNENKENIYIVDDEKDLDFEKSGRDFNIMPEEFFNSKYQQSRVRKEQQMQKEKELIDKKKREKEEKLKKLSELEKQRREKDDLKKERERFKDEEKRKKQEEIDLINKKRQEEREKIKQEEDRLRQEREAAIKRKTEKEKRLRDLDQKAKEERRALKKEQKELLKKELEKRAEILRLQNAGMNEDQKNKEVEKALASERAEILKKIKLEQKLNKKEQDRIRKEIKEEEKKKLEDERNRLEQEAKLAMGNSSKNELNLDFVDDGRLANVENKKKGKQKIIITVFGFLGLSFVLFIILQSQLFYSNKNNNKNTDINNSSNDYSIRINDKSTFTKTFKSFNGDDIEYFASFNDRRDIDSIDFNILDSSGFNLNGAVFGVFTFGKQSKLNKDVNIKISNINCLDNSLKLKYFDDSVGLWSDLDNVSCLDSLSSFVVNNNLYKYYAVISESSVVDNSDNNFDNFDSVLNYNYKYKFSRFFDFYKYGIDNNNSNGYISNKEKVIYGSTIGRVDDSDGDGYLDGEEVMNLYDPAIKLNGESLDLRLIDSKKVLPYKFGYISFYYPANFIEPFNLQESIIVSPDVNSKEYISFSILKNDKNISFSDFLKSQEDSSDFYRIRNFSDTIFNDFYVNKIGNNSYLDIGDNNILKVSYSFESKEFTSYLATYLMVLKSINISK